MKKSLFAALVAVCMMIGTSASAQKADHPASHHNANRPSVEECAKSRSEKLKNELSLDDKQAQQIYDQMLSRSKERAAMQKKHAESADRIRQEHDREMKQILNDEQYAKWQKMHAGREGDHQPKAKYNKNRQHKQSGPSKECGVKQ